MLKISDISQYPEGHPLYQFQRNKQVVQIRREERQVTFRKKRLFTFNSKPQNSELCSNHQQNEDDSPQQSCESKFLIADERYSEYIKQLNLCQYTNDQIPSIIELVKQQEEMTLICGVIALRKILSKNPPPIQEVIDSGIIDRLLQLALLQQSPQIQLESIWCLTNIASGTTDQCSTIISKGGIPLLVNTLSNENNVVAEQAVWAIGNISSDCTQFRDFIIEAGGIDSLVKFVGRDKLNSHTLNECCWSLSNLCRGNPIPDYRLVQPAVDTLCSLLAEEKIKDSQIYAESCWAISYQCEGLRQRVGPILSTNLLNKLIPVITKADHVKMILPGLRVVGQVSTGNEECINALIQNGGLQLLEKVLFHQKTLLRREACWVISNIMASNLNHITQVLERQKIMRQLLQLFSTDSADVKSQICYIFSNMAEGARAIDVDKLIVETNVLQGYIELLCSQDDKYVQTSLQCLSHLLRVGEKKKIQRGLEESVIVRELMRLKGDIILEKLQYYQNENIYYSAIQILTNYFQLEDPFTEHQKKLHISNVPQNSLRYNSDNEESDDDEFK